MKSLHSSSPFITTHSSLACNNETSEHHQHQHQHTRNDSTAHRVPSSSLGRSSRSSCHSSRAQAGNTTPARQHPTPLPVANRHLPLLTCSERSEEHTSELQSLMRISDAD